MSLMTRNYSDLFQRLSTSMPFTTQVKFWVRVLSFIRLLFRYRRDSSEFDHLTGLQKDTFSGAPNSPKIGTIRLLRLASIAFLSECGRTRDSQKP